MPPQAERFHFLTEFQPETISSGWLSTHQGSLMRLLAISILTIAAISAQVGNSANLRRPAKNLVFDDGDELVPGGLSAFQITRPFFAQLFVARLVTGPVPMRRTERSAPPMPDPIAG